jgi:hypothetical protein
MTSYQVEMQEIIDLSSDRAIGEGGGAREWLEYGGATRQMERPQNKEPMVNAAGLPTDLPPA